jgi:hypothetical protein
MLAGCACFGLASAVGLVLAAIAFGIAFTGLAIHG